MRTRMLPKSLPPLGYLKLKAVLALGTFTREFCKACTDQKIKPENPKKPPQTCIDQSSQFRSAESVRKCSHMKKPAIPIYGATSVS